MEIWKFTVQDVYSEWKHREYAYFNGKPSKVAIEASEPWAFFLKERSWLLSRVDAKSYCDKLIEGLLRKEYESAGEAFGFDLEQIEIHEANPQEKA